MTRCAQSRGEWPGARRTFFEGREDGGRDEAVGVSERLGGVRMVDAGDGGGRRVGEALGRVRLTVAGRRDGGGIRLEGEIPGIGGTEAVGRGGGGMAGWRPAEGWSRRMACGDWPSGF